MTEIGEKTSDIKLQTSERIRKYETIMEKLKRALNSNGWDGRWFKRAFMDDGSTLRKYGK